MDSRLVLGILVSITTLLTMMMGAYVSATDSGLGCQDKWPLCEDAHGNQQVFPDWDNAPMVIEWLHRAVASTLGLLAIGWLFILGRQAKAEEDGDTKSKKKRLAYLALGSLMLIIVQGMLGAVVVWVELTPIMVSFHQGTAAVTFAFILFTTQQTRHLVLEEEKQPSSPETSEQDKPKDEDEN